MNQQQTKVDRYGHPTSDWTKNPPSPKSPCEVHGTLLSERIGNAQGKTDDYEFAILVQSADPTQDDAVSKVALSRALQVELTPTAPGSEYGILRIVGTDAILNLLCHCRTFSFAYFAQSCIAACKLTLKVRDGDGPFVPHTIELNAGSSSLAASLADAAEFLEQSSAEALVDCFGAIRNFDFYCDFVPALAQPGGGRVLNMLDAIKTLERDWFSYKMTTGKLAMQA
jgi:hypothetical protein